MLVGIGAGVHQRRNDSRISVSARQRERRGTLAVRGFDIRAGANQDVHHLLIASEHGPMQRRRAISLRRTHIGVLLEQGAHGRLVAFHGCVYKVASPGSDAAD